MAVSETRDELLAAIEKTFVQLERDLDRVPLGTVRDPVLDGHAKDTKMSPSDLVAYLIGWNQQVLIWHQRRSAGLPDEFPAAGIKWNQLGALAQRFYSEHETESWDYLREELRDAKASIIELINGYEDDELYGEPWYGKWTMGRMISFNTSSPYVNARSRIRAWLRTGQ
ncbi:MAG: ClbS/DfsB family four-helix bundle protein [Corynebacterium casei]|uniref:ClbS/DfsB family four-helix bundle protein n=1 Tax=Corynebacterium casei UCMA 3821 TaxID=1110505 RepID=G7HWC9_9CORY|nr:ClbS/DfsB family four-helix bundle protein [Corynebacterium casei]MDN5800731.1 ClbS/DfsB family four-helix bundle protein [Corynebacterium casei]MDN5826344.1 ClbS/DfsB family four-helix bundle protein [Corynebacterium casei]MDN5922435.1 ClbS/DfsB family four-helix bundle protein [Corynebacterium casei]MDN6131802.1 ClbS/DfsB family four-helix bundle protein [Corynebacterium casei]MDN6155968.1 ClbS/DfsB family four-helix bundle protein [Corynebacterium casei]